MRRPIQIPPSEFDPRKPPLTSEDLADEIRSSEVYGTETKRDLCKVLTGLCELVVCLTDLTMVLYPAAGSCIQVSSTARDAKEYAEKLMRLKIGLAAWKARGFVWMPTCAKPVHPSVTLNIHLTSMYYE